MDRLKKQMEFILEIDKMKQIMRQTYLADGSRKENDAEHTWHMTMMCMILSEYANEEIDVFHTMKLLMVHDLVEIYAGDTYAYDEKANIGKEKREEEAAKKLFSMLPEDQGVWIGGLFQEFEAMETGESKFANVLDKIQPLLLNHASGGKSWIEHGVKEAQVLKRNEKVHEGSQVLWDYAKQLIEENVLKGNLIRES